MSSANTEEQIRDFYDFAARNGFSEDLFLRAENLEDYMRTAIDGYAGYPLFQYVYGGKYDANTFHRMLAIDLKCRLHTTVGIASSNAYESVFLAEPPLAERTGMRQYIWTKEKHAYTLFFEPAMYRQEAFERYARKKREAFLDAETWYMYVFATKQEVQHQGHGQKLMRLMLDFLDEKGARGCLETNHAANVPMYEHFGFTVADRSVYKEKLEHYVMLYEPGSRKG